MKKLVGLLTLTLSTSLMAFEGGSSSGGGNFRELEFHARINKIVVLLSSDTVISQYPESLSADAVKDLSPQLKIEFTELPLAKEGVAKDALNFPADRRILISTKSWDDLIASPSQKDLLVFHELLGIMQIDDSNYRYSLKLLPQIAQYNQDRCDDEIDYQLEHIEGVWAFNSSASVLMKTKVIASGPKSIMLWVQSCDRAMYLQSLGGCVPAFTPDGRQYTDFSAQYSVESGKFHAPAYFSLKVDCAKSDRLSYDEDRPDGTGLSYVLKRHR